MKMPEYTRYVKDFLKLYDQYQFMERPETPQPVVLSQVQPLLPQVIHITEPTNIKDIPELNIIVGPAPYIDTKFGAVQRLRDMVSKGNQSNWVPLN